MEDTDRESQFLFPSKRQAADELVTVFFKSQTTQQLVGVGFDIIVFHGVDTRRVGYSLLR